MQSQKQWNDLGSFQGKPFNISVIQRCAPVTNDKEAQIDPFYEDLTITKNSTKTAMDNT